MTNDSINHPTHYNFGKIEVIEFIEDQRLGFHLGNAVKYVARAGKKDPRKTIEDLEKAIWYIRRQIECHMASVQGRDKVRPNDMPQERTSVFSNSNGGRTAVDNIMGDQPVHATVR